MVLQEEVIRARVPVELKQAFENVVSAEDQTASQVLRRLMREYVQAHSQQALFGVKRRRQG